MVWIHVPVRWTRDVLFNRGWELARRRFVCRVCRSRELMGYVLGICRGIMVSRDGLVWRWQFLEWRTMSRPVWGNGRRLHWRDKGFSESFSFVAFAFSFGRGFSFSFECRGHVTTLFSCKVSCLHFHSYPERRVTNPDQVQLNYPWKIDERSRRSQRRKQNAKLVDK